MTRFSPLLLMLFASFAAPVLAQTADIDPAPVATPATTEENPAVANPRNVFTVSYKEDAEDAIGKALTEKGVGDNVAVLMNGRKLGAMTAFDKPVTLDAKGLQFDQQSRRWTANLLFLSEGEVVTAMPASGHFENMLEVPVLKREVRNGDIIAQTDIEVRNFPMSRTRTDTVTDLASLIGKSPVRSISAFRPIREQEVASPSIVKKASMVQVRYQAPGMQITASGQAMDDGAKGDVINVKNLDSKKIIRAVIEDSNTVVISSGVAVSSNTTPVTTPSAEADHAAN